MRSRFLFHWMFFLVLFVGCKSDDKENIENVLLKSALKTDDNNINEVFIVFYQGKKGVEFQPKKNFTFSLKQGNSSFKYSDFSEEGLLKKNKDSILVSNDEKRKIDIFFKHENLLFKNVYGDTIGEKSLWKIYFINKEGSIFKFMDIDGETQDQEIKSLKSSCDFLLEKLKDKS